ILLDSSDDSSYNQLAWIRATCSDASVRNGKEAVSAASKTCELTEWKDWEFIDTLAAAYAEAGDFKRAIEFQQQALRTGNPSESEQKEMRERLSLYELSKPFRDKADKPCQPVRDNPQPVNVRHDTRPRHHGAFPFIQRRRRVGDRPAMRRCVIGLINAGIQITQAKLLFKTTDKKRTGNLRALPLSYSGVWSRRPDSNRRPRRYQR